MIDTSSRRWWALGGLTLAVLAVGLDGTILSVALPTLATTLHASESDLQWFTSGYFLVLAAAMIPAGILGDRYGRKRVLLCSLALFGFGSAACAYAPSAGAFIAARVVLGLAGAGIIVMALAGLTVLFSEDERPKAVGVWAAANFLALPIGPILGGWLLTNYWWGWVFLLNVPVAVIGLIAGIILVPESRAPERPALDIIGIITSTAGLTLLTYGFISAGESSWTGAAAVSAMIAGLALLIGFFAWERRLTAVSGSSESGDVARYLGLRRISRLTGRPLVDLDLFRSPSFTWGVILATVGVLAMIGVLFTLPQYFQGVVGTDAMGSGLRLLPLIAGLVVGAIPADRVARRIGAKFTVASGFAVLAAGLALGAATSITSSGGFVAVWMALVGAGMGMSMATAASAALSELPEERSGVGSALMQAMQKIGGPFGAAVLGSVLTSIYHAHLQLTGLPKAAAETVRESIFGGIVIAGRLHSPALLHSVRAAFVDGMDVALMVSAGIAVAGFVLTLIFLPAHRQRTADSTQLEYEVEREHAIVG